MCEPTPEQFQTRDDEHTSREIHMREFTAAAVIDATWDAAHRLFRPQRTALR
jgi:hypothetical protein